MRERTIQSDALVALSRIPDVWVHPNPVGHGYTHRLGPALDKALEHLPIARGIAEQTLLRFRLEYGLGDGSPDLIVSAGGLFLGLEMKSAEGRLRESQKIWRRMADGRSVPYATARSVDEALDAVRRRRER